ncbi:MAG: enoyl-CoA hydratase/isomerase family protein [Geodermatophilaceae bacterium]|nr:enoyl-CoA hydratase/isomerase family protein [Geodermatophilaceae bacterium]
MASAEFVTLEVADGIGTIRLSRPPMNALNRQLQEEIRGCALEAGARADVRAVIVYGGEKVFAAGADIKEMSSMGYNDMASRAHELSGSFSAVAAIPKPTIAAITGYALGGGYELALCCDFRIAGENAKVGQPEILLGIIPGAGGTQRLARLVGPAKAKDIVYTGRFVGAEEALAIGMVDVVVGPDDVYDTAMQMAEKFSRGPAAALRAAKAAIDGGLDGDLASGLRLESTLFAALFATEDQKLGMDSFVENGPGKAEFTGR